MKTSIKLLLAAVVGSSLGVVDLQAQPAQIIGTAGTSSMTTDVVVGDAAESTLQSYLHADRSYECALLQSQFTDQAGTDADDFRVFNTTILDPDGASASATANGNVFPQMATIKPLNMSSSISSSQQARLRYSLVATKTGLHKFTTSDALSNGGQDSYKLRCRETTLYGSYNRFFAQAAIVEIQNKAQTSFPIQITIIDAGGNIVVNKQGATVNANTRTDIIFGSLPASNYGQIIITHTAPFGALSGVVAEYDQSSNGSITLKRERPLSLAQRS